MPTDSSSSSSAPSEPSEHCDVPIDWEALEDAFENNAPEVHSYLHVSTGDVLRIVDGVADPQMHARIASDAAYLRIEPVSSREQYRWMERYIPMVEDDELKDRLRRAIDGKGAFRRFKDVLMGFGAERERWFAFRSERLRIFMEAWLNAHALNPVKRTAWPAKDATVPEARVSSAGRVTPSRRSRGGDDARGRLLDIIETMGVRDLDRLMTFAEFLGSRSSKPRSSADGSRSGGTSRRSEPLGRRERPRSRARSRR